MSRAERGLAGWVLGALCVACAGPRTDPRTDEVRWEPAVRELARGLADRAEAQVDLRAVRVEVRPFESDADPVARAAALRVRAETLAALAVRMRVLDPEVPLLRPASFGPTHAVLGSVERDVEGVYVQLRLVDLASEGVLVPVRGRVPLRAELIAGAAVLETEPVAAAAPVPTRTAAPTDPRSERLAPSAPAMAPSPPGPGQARLKAWKALFERP